MFAPASGLIPHPPRTRTLLAIVLALVMAPRLASADDKAPAKTGSTTTGSSVTDGFRSLGQQISDPKTLDRIKGHEQLRTIPVVVLTSSKEESDIVESYHLGVNSYIVKPVDFDQFAEAVRQLGLYWLLLNQPPVRRP